MKRRVIALGFFDGVHIGHAALLKKARQLADDMHLTACALTFDTHPDELVKGIRLPLLNTLSERRWLMQSLFGMDEMLVLQFDRNRMHQHWQDFVTRTLIEEYCAAYVVCGHDFRFGARGEGDPTRLAEKCRQLGVGCECIAEVKLDGETVSSTRIRGLLDNGETEKAVALLGHPHIFIGKVIDGRKLGRTLGIPTANLSVDRGVLIPKYGVYAAKACFDDTEHLAVVNIGMRPTVSGQHVTLEPWILDFDGDLYGKELRLELYAFLRAEKRFDSLEALRAQILRNAEQTRAYFQTM